MSTQEEVTKSIEHAFDLAIEMFDAMARGKAVKMDEAEAQLVADAFRKLKEAL